MSLTANSYPANAPDLYTGPGLRELEETGRSLRLEPSDELLASFGATATGHAYIAAEGLRPTEDAYTKLYDEETCEVHVNSRVTLEDYERITPPQEMARLKEYAEAMAGKELLFVNATYAGGGVAIMRAPLVHLLRSVGVNARWFTMRPDEEGFKVTKGKFHNVLQDVAKPPGTRLTEEDKGVYEPWLKKVAEDLEEPLTTADVIVIDDWQPSGLIPYIKGFDTVNDGGTEHHTGFNPDAKIIFRDHIHTEGALMGTPGTPQHTTWKYIWDHNRVNEADVFITHPMDEFVPPDVPEEKVVFMPATGDLLDDLNRPLTDGEKRRGLAFINGQLEENEGQTPVDLNRPYIVLIARFDPSKGMPQGMESYVRAREKMKAEGVKEEELPQLVMLGNGSVDDPDGKPVLAEVMRIRSERYGDIKDDIKVARVPHNDVAINALLKGASLALQPSTKEGFESRVSDAIFQGVPVIGSNRGGIPLQIVEGESGYVIDPYDTKQWADRISELMTGSERYKAMKARTAELAVTYNSAFTTVPNATRWLALSTTLLTNPSFQGNRRWVEELAA